MRAGRHCLLFTVGAAIVLGALLVVPGQAQSDETPLGDVARAYRKNQTAPRRVIDNDNLPEVMEEAQNKKWATVALRLALDPVAMQVVNTSSPDVMCALSYSAQSSDLKPEAPEAQKLPAGELLKLDGPASIVGGALQVSVYNGTDWDVQEITVGLTVVRREGAPVAARSASAKLVPAAMNTAEPAEKRADVTLLYHLKGKALPQTTTLFSENLNIPLNADQEWHWSIIEAKGTPPPEPLPAN